MKADEVAKLSDIELKELYKIIKVERNYRYRVEQLKKGNELRTRKEKSAIGNSKYELKKLPYRGQGYKKRIPWLISFLKDQDWSYLFSEYNLNIEKKYCVYAHINPYPTDEDLIKIFRMFGTPFYIGKGTEDRAYNLNRNQGHGKQIKKLINRGYKKETIVHIIKNELTELEAFVLESKLIYFFGTIYEFKDTGILYNLDIPPTPDFKYLATKKIKVRKRIMEGESGNL